MLSVLEYSVWADLDPEDAILHGRNNDLRANRIITVDRSVEEKIADAIYAYVSQQKIIEGLVNARSERKTHDGRYLEVYLTLDCRPKINFAPYAEFIKEING